MDYNTGNTSSFGLDESINQNVSSKDSADTNTVTNSNDNFGTSDCTNTTTKENDDNKSLEDTSFKKPIFISRTSRLDTLHAENKEKEKDKECKNTISECLIVPRLPEKSPAQMLAEKSVPLPYKEPSWSGLPPAAYSFEVLKNGTIIDVIHLNRPISVVGRLAQCDIVMEHPSLSRFHCIIQYRLVGSDTQPQGFYAYDLGSTHGSFHNKHPMKPHTYYHLRVGHMLKFGGSTRMLILQGPEDDQEPESELTVTELKALAAERAKKLEQLETGELEENNPDQQKEKSEISGESQEDKEGIDWGMGDDAVEEAEEEENPFASLNEELYLDDPKKTLRGWFEREGYDLPSYETEDISQGFYKCKVELPVPGPAGGPLVAIVEHKGKKKEAVIQCALEACRLLDRQGVLRQAKHESHERKKRDWAENDYYDSDDDDFLDRTGDVQRKRIRRMRDAVGKDNAFVENYDTLITKYNEVTKELATLEEKLAKADFLKQVSECTSVADDDLDTYLNKLQSEVPDKHKRVTWKLRAVDLRKDELRLRRLSNIARPLGVPELQPYQPKYEMSSSKQNLKLEPLGEKCKESLKPASISTKPKEHSLKPHKIFLEEEPEQRPRLRRLDEIDDELPAKAPRKEFKRDSIKKSESAVPRNSVSKTIMHSYKSSGVQLLNDRSAGKMKTVKERELPPPELHHAGTSDRRGVDSEVNRTEDIVNTYSDCTQQESNNNKTKTNSSSDTSLLKSNIPEISTNENSLSKGTEENCPEKKLRILGPSLPHHLAHLKTAQQGPTGTKKRYEKKSRYYDDDNPNYDTWIPPEQQSGDGRTKLNEKLGY